MIRPLRRAKFLVPRVFRDWANSPLNTRRFGVFWAQRRARIGLILFLNILFFSMTAELWSHHNPLILVREMQSGSKFYFPALVTYSAQDFGIEDAFVVDYQQFLDQEREAGRGSWAIWPLNRWDPYVQTADVMVAPSSEHWLGTDNLGRDVTARLLYGIRVSLTFGLALWFFSFAGGVMIGVCQGYFAGRFDFFVERLKELAEIIPFLSVVILVNGIIKGQGFILTLAIVLLFAWIGISSQMRAQVLALRRREFADAVIAMGGTHARIITRHILPNALTPILTLTPFAISGGIGTLTVLDYLGFGLSPPTPSIGELLAQGRNYITNAVWLLLAPTGALIVLLVAINMIGEALREAFDPRA
jgi:microcin C transport system permease protein